MDDIFDRMRRGSGDDLFDRLRRGLPLTDEDDPKRAQLKAQGYSESGIEKLLLGADPWSLHPDDYEKDDLEWTYDELDAEPGLMHVAPLPDEPDKTIFESPPVEYPKPGTVASLPSNPESAPVVPHDDELSPQERVARQLLPDSQLSDLEYRVRYGRDRNQAKPIQSWSPPSDRDIDGWGGGRGML